ncbi:MAG: pyridoxal-5'-phosphate-dependent protein [Sphingobacteriales bacterium 41-5]|nr:MAG: pyridoxal-5'-phosphate-dependent protein [Niabella sp. SCN 42-15]OJU28226.1 MAG: pyridoxal-5'-phosphate-dependent protein [Sphingobacteriales bacterium 41-5]
MVPLVKTNIPSKEELMPFLEKILYSGYVAQGEQVDCFEKDFNRYIGGNHSLSLNSGTSALHIALILAGVEEGSEVISTALTAEPTNVAIKMVGAKIRYADIDIDTGSICPQSITENINANTKAIMVVDYAGIPVNVPEIQKISKKYDLPVIHDAAHSLGAKFNGQKTGNHFSYTVFSFQAIKHLTTIDGGMLQITSKEEFEKAKLIRWFGIDKKLTRLENNIRFQGYKYHMNNVNAAIGLVQLKSIEKIIDIYIDNGKFYDAELQNIAGLNLLNYYPGSEPSYWLYTLLVENKEDFIRKLSEGGIMASELHKRNDRHDYLNDFNQKLPRLDRFYDKMVHIPCGWWVDNEIRERIVNTIKQGW